MTTAEQAAFQVPVIQERDDLALAGINSSAHRAGSIAAAAARAAEVASTVLGVDKQAAEDTFTGQLEAMGIIAAMSADLVPVVHVSVGAEDEDGHVWTPSHVVKGHDALTMGGETIPETFIWSDMYANRPAAWWNKTRPEGQGESELAEAPLQILLADVALRGTNKKWDKQQTELAKLIKGHKSETTTLEGMPVLAWEMMDADAIIGGTERPDTDTVNRFVQHEMDRSGGGWSYGPFACVYGREADLGGSYGAAYSVYGFRAAMGQKQTA